MYLASAAVFLAEAAKLPCCLYMVARVGGGCRGFVELLQSEVLNQPGETLKCAVPALAYTVQGNLLFAALSNLDPDQARRHPPFPPTNPWLSRLGRPVDQRLPI